MAYESVKLKQDLVIHEVISIHYFEYFSDFSFPGESHDFWEFLCVDKGEVNILIDRNLVELHKNDIVFHKPNEFHSVIANGISAPNLVVISFRCKDPYMQFFKDKIFSIQENERALLASIIQEARLAFEGRLDDPYQEKLKRHKKRNFGSEQLIKLYLEQFLITLFRRLHDKTEHRKNAKFSKPSAQDSLEKIHHYMEEHIHLPLRIRQICRDNLISRSKLQNLMMQESGKGIIEYFSHLKIEKAKSMIRTGDYNFTQTAEMLGYSSIHYFSRQFKKLTGMSPSEYASSIKAMAEKRS